jgi:AcrR family transcriptional regulator
MTTFRRAHSPEQREVRRSAILGTASEMLTEMSSAAITLNELSRRAGMAKSNVLRYFESREAVLLELCNEHVTAWIDDLGPALEAAVDEDAAVDVRAGQLLDTLVASVTARPVLCDLLSTQAAVLEHNISTAAMLKFKRISTANIGRLVDVVHRLLPELGADGAERFTLLAAILTSAMWTHSHPPSAVIAAYEADPQIACYRIEFTTALRDALHIVMTGLLAETRDQRR